MVTSPGIVQPPELPPLSSPSPPSSFPPPSFPEPPPWPGKLICPLKMPAFLPNELKLKASWLITLLSSILNVISFLLVLLCPKKGEIATTAIKCKSANFIFLNPF